MFVHAHILVYTPHIHVSQIAKYLIEIFPDLVEAVDTDHHTAMDYAVQLKFVSSKTEHFAIIVYTALL